MSNSDTVQKLKTDHLTTDNCKTGPIAQLGARLNGIEKVEGSNPSGSTVCITAYRYALSRSSRPASSEPGQMVRARQGYEATDRPNSPGSAAGDGPHVGPSRQRERPL